MISHPPVRTDLINLSRRLTESKNDSLIDCMTARASQFNALQHVSAPPINLGVCELTKIPASGAMGEVALWLVAALCLCCCAVAAVWWPFLFPKKPVTMAAAPPARAEKPVPVDLMEAGTLAGHVFGSGGTRRPQSASLSAQKHAPSSIRHCRLAGA